MRIVRAVDFAHAAFAEQRDDLIRTDFSPGGGLHFVPLFYLRDTMIPELRIVIRFRALPLSVLSRGPGAYSGGSKTTVYSSR